MRNKFNYDYKIIILSFCFFFVSFTALGQIITKGFIKFERTINLKQQETVENLSSNSNKIYQGVKYSKTYFSYIFNPTQTLYTFVEEDAFFNDSHNSSGTAAKKNVVYSDYRNNKMIVQKNVFNMDFQIEDSIKRFRWKIEDEIRTIAGYVCRKATTTICDSVAVIAFYTTQIASRGGPESLGGLPGMILGVAVPKLFSTWFATEITIQEQLIVPIKEKENSFSNYSFIAFLVKNQNPTNRNVRPLIWWSSL